MKRIIAIIAIAAVSGSCAAPGQITSSGQPNDCDGTGKTNIHIRYGDSYIEATPRGKAKRKGEIVYKLFPRKNQPSGIDYSTVVVDIDGKRDPEDKWLDKSAAAGNGKTKIFICVPPNQANGTYSFNVIVPGVGKIDPRIRVEN